MRSHMEKDYSILEKCVCCGGKVTLILDLNTQPLANSYHSNTVVLSEFPLALNMCESCFHAQQAVAVNPDLMFKDYAYVSGTSQTLRDYFDTFAAEVENRYRASFGSKKSVLDIACNDGTQLVSFIRKGWEAFGVDPAQNLIDRSRAIGATVLCDYWNVETAKKFNRKFDVLIAQNVFAHVSDPKGFLDACKLVMHEGSKLLIQTSQADMIARGEFDTIYHEHISFFSARSMQTLATRAGFILEDIFIGPIHGGSYIFVLGFGTPLPGVETRLAYEASEGRYTKAFFEKFADTARAAVSELKKTVETYKSKGKKVVGFGAAAKGNTLLNFGKIKLDYIVDENPLKQNLYTPGMNIPIYDIKHLAQEKSPVIVVPLAWNFFDEIYKKVKQIRPDSADTFITYFPSITERQ